MTTIWEEQTQGQKRRAAVFLHFARTPSCKMQEGYEHYQINQDDIFYVYATGLPDQSPEFSPLLP